MYTVFLIILIILGLVGAGCGLFFLTRRAETKQAAREVDSVWRELTLNITRRNHYIQQLITLLLPYADYERELYAECDRVREASLAATNPTSAGELEPCFKDIQQRLFKIVDFYPPLQQDGAYLTVENELHSINTVIEANSVTYNNVVTRLNALIRKTPRSFFKSAHEVGPREPFAANTSPVLITH